MCASIATAIATRTAGRVGRTYASQAASIAPAPEKTWISTMPLALHTTGEAATG